MSERSVVIVGGGLAGMSAALALARLGVCVQLLEAKRRLGGRTGSFTIPSQTVSFQSSTGSTEATVDYCQHVAMGCCTNLRQFVEWLGQTDQWKEYNELHFISSQGKYQRLKSLPWLPAPLHLSHWLLRWPNLSLLDRLAVARGMLAIQRLKLCEALESLPALPWLKSHGQTDGSLQHFWSTILVSALGAELDAVNLGAVAKVMQDGFLRHRNAYHLLVPQQPLDKLFNVEATLRLRDAGVKIACSSQVKSIVLEQSGAGVEVITDDGRYRGDACIVAVPWHAMAKIATDSSLHVSLQGIAERASELQSSPITGVHMWWDKDWLELPQVAIVGRLCQWVFSEPCRPAETGNIEAGQHAESNTWYCQVVISASHCLPSGNPQLIQQMILSDLAELFPKSRQCRLLQFKTVTDPQAVFGIGPSSLRLRPLTTAAAPKMLLAGDWTRTGWPATMEGAVISGFRAAEEFLAGVGLPASIVAPPLGGRRKVSSTPQDSF